MRRLTDTVCGDCRKEAAWMGVRITNGEAVLFDSTTGIAFRPAFAHYDAAEAFFRWSLTHVDRDLWHLAETELSRAHYDWHVRAIEYRKIRNTTNRHILNRLVFGIPALGTDSLESLNRRYQGVTGSLAETVS
jgi:hypothetical protein